MAEKQFAKLGLSVVYKAHKIDREGYTKEGKYYGYSSSQPNTVYEWSIQQNDPWEELAYGTDRATSISALMTKIKSNHKNAFRQGNPTVTASSLPIGTWQPAHAIRQNADGSVDILREKNSGRRANISEGFMDANGLFHPIRHSADYDSSRVGESKQYKKKRKKGTRATPTGRRYTAKKASTKPAMATSRREYGGDGSRYGNPGEGIYITSTPLAKLVNSLGYSLSKNATDHLGKKRSYRVVGGGRFGATTNYFNSADAVKKWATRVAKDRQLFS